MIILKRQSARYNTSVGYDCSENFWGRNDYLDGPKRVKDMVEADSYDDLVK